jgi:predicted AAA+ superfamily ATPase
MFIQRTLAKTVVQSFHLGKVIIILGPRQVGKTTMIRRLGIPEEESVWLNADNLDVQELFNDQLTASRFKAFIGKKAYVFIDEAQRVGNIGLKLKRLVDEIKDVQFIATGSSAFELANSVNEPLTGRKWEHMLYPISFGEMVEYHGLLEEKRLLNHRLVFGYYPEIVTHAGEELRRLKVLTDSYLYKDILSWEGIQKPDKLVKLLTALAYQIGSQVSYNELGQLCGLDFKTVEKYILLLEQSFIIFRMGSFSRNLRNELKASRKIYFYDNGIRNALLANFTPAESRMDIGALWENFVVSERKKYNAYHELWKNSYFWKLKSQQEIDLLEENDGQLCAFEMKWNAKKQVRIPLAFRNAYPDAQTAVITPDNVHEFLL